MKQKTEITFEVEETIILRQVAETLTAFCSQCQASVEMITPQHAVALFNLSEREIFRLMEAGKIQFYRNRQSLCLSGFADKRGGIA